jgi:acetyltransferase-like isoleucine patch superfamily enzyme
MFIKKIINELDEIYRIDVLSFRSRFFLFLFNLIPDFYAFRFVTNLLLILGGAKLQIMSSYIRSPFHCTFLCNLSINEGVFINKGCRIEASAPVSIGKKTKVGPGVMIETVNHLENFKDEHLPVFIEDNVWLGANVVVTPGAYINSNIIVGAGAVVVKKIMKQGVYVGIPAKKLFD